MKTTFKKSMLLSASTIAAALSAFPAYAQDAQTSDADVSTGEAIIVTGSRIARPNLESASPIAVVTGEQTTKNADVTLDTYLNTLPQVNPAGTTTSNNPGNGGQSNVNLRGLGSNRNLVLVDGRRPMVSGTDQTVDLNTIPQALIERIEIVTGGAGATYGADAIAGVVNLRMKDDFEGLDLRATYANSIPETDAREWQISGLIGGNFADDRGNIAVAIEHSERQGLTKGQRAFSKQATSTTRTFPTGRIAETSQNPFSQAAINAVFGSYGSLAKDIPQRGQSNIGFNNGGTLFGTGTFNQPADVTNFRYALDSPANPNLNFFPDFYSYNFDIINLLVLPLDRTSAFMRGHYEITPNVEFFTQAAYTEYDSASALAPTPVGTRIGNPTTNTNPGNAVSNLVAPGGISTGLLVPSTNPFITADLRTLLDSRTGDRVALAGSGATEAFQLSKRFLDTGLRRTANENQVIQGLAGLRGEFAEGWRYEAYYSKGRTIIDNAASGNVNVQRVQELLESPTGGTNLCAGGFNPFGINPLSQACITYIDETGFTSTKFTQDIAQAYVAGDLVEMPAGALSIVLGAEHRKFKYSFDPGVLSGPIAGFNVQTADKGTNTFLDYFGEVLIPLIKDGFVNSAELTLSARHSTSDFNDIQNGVDGKKDGSWAYGATLSVEPFDSLRMRGSYQHTVRAPNFGELFSGGGSFPQYFDPCSVTSNFRQSGGAAARSLCAATGVGAPDSYVQTPGSQVFIGFVGNPNLKPEESDTFTLGAVFQKFGFTGSVDYYNIKITKPIFGPDPNLLIAACYGYHGVNTGLSAANPYCQGFFRTPDISFISIPVSLGGDGSGYFQAINQGKIKTSGIDVQLGYSLPTEFIDEESSIDFNLFFNYLIDFKVQELPGVTIDYSDTVSYFGAGLGTSFPRIRATLDTAFNLNENLKIDTRVRYIDGMKNRASKQFPGETLFTGPDAVIYVDLALQAKVDALTFRIGVNNLFDRQPEQYAPNVQSGTDPSLYDVIGRRAYVSVGLRF